jgi:hypothetical protein
MFIKRTIPHGIQADMPGKWKIRKAILSVRESLFKIPG